MLKHWQKLTLFWPSPNNALSTSCVAGLSLDWSY